MSRSGRLRRLLGSLALLLCSFLGSVALGAAVTFAATTKASNSSSSSATTTNDRHIQEQQERMHLKVLLKQEFLDRVPSCRHTFSQIELTNTHFSEPITIHSIQTTPEETFLIRYDHSKRQSEDGGKNNNNNNMEEEVSAPYKAGSWDQKSIPQQVHISKLPNGEHGFTLGPGQTAVIPVTFLPRYPCTLGGDGGNDGLADYYAPYQVAYSTSFDPDDEDFSLGQPPPPKFMEYKSGTARADWEQLLREMPPQERSNWQQQLQKRYQEGNTRGIPQELLDWQDGSFGALPDSSGEEWIFEVKTTFIINTSRGTIRIPMEASSVRQNAYGLPDVIFFDQHDSQNMDGDGDADDGGGNHHLNARTDDNEEEASTSQKRKGVLWLDTDLDGDERPHGNEEASPMTNRECYNVIMSNPSLTEDLEVLEVFLTRPDLMNLQVQGDLRAPSSSINQWWGAPRRNLNGEEEKEEEEGPKHQHGSLPLAPGEQRYVVTVCTSRSSIIDTTNVSEWFHSEEDNVDQALLGLDEPQSSFMTRAERASARAAKSAAKAEYSLGFLLIRTKQGETFFVALEKDRKECRSDLDNAFPDGGAFSDQLTPQAAPADLSRRQQTYPPSYHHALYKTQEIPISELAARFERHSTSMTAPSTPLMTSALKSVPPRIDFTLLSSSSPSVVFYLAIHNPKDYPLKIMRTGVAVEIEDDSDPAQPNPDKLGMHMSVKINKHMLEADGRTEKALVVTCSINWDLFQAHNLESLFYHGNVIMRATAHVDFDYNQWIRNLLKKSAKRQQGKIVISHDYASEENNFDDNRQTEFVLEIPLTVSMIEGKLGIMIHRTSHPFPHLWAVRSWKEGLGSVSSIFYPERTFDIRAELDSGGQQTEPIFGPSGIDHKLRIFSNINIPSGVSNDENYETQLLEIDTAAVHAFEGDLADSGEIESPEEKGEGENVCNRFSISVSPPPEGDFPFEGFHDVGLVHIKYRFSSSEDGAEGTGEWGEPIEYDSVLEFPKHCYLTLTTKPYTELHRIPLIIYPGHTDITATNSHSPSRMNQTQADVDVSERYKKKNKKGKEKENSKAEREEDLKESHAVVGFGSLLHWLRGSTVWPSLKEFLEQSGARPWDRRSNKRGQDTEEKLLSQYILSLCRRSRRVRKAHLKPILLKAGAVKHGAMEASSFYMTNHNPIPLLVTIDVGEIEGMSISLARVPTRGRGDGNNILDHFPKEKNILSGHLGPYSHLVPDGDFRGHPVAGLREFLQKTDIAREVLSPFRFRDAISRSASAIERQPLLNILYKKYAFGEFHRDPLPMRFSEDGWSKCLGRREAAETSHYYAEYDPNSTSSDDDSDDEYDAYVEKVRAGEIPPGPLMLSDDYPITKPLKVCWDRDAEPMSSSSDGTYIIVPPGAVARFDLKISAPPRSMLRNDITRLLSTGLVLSTDHGEILPVLVAFEALLGGLHVTSNSTSESTDLLDVDGEVEQEPNDLLRKNMSVIRVPAGLFEGKFQRDNVEKEDDTASELIRSQLSNSSSEQNSMLPKKNGTVSIFITSSFSRDVRLLEVSSCNPWLYIRLTGTNISLPVSHRDRTQGSMGGEPQGVIISRINCDTGHNLSTLFRYPSFYQCALNWLTNRAAVQPRECGLSPSLHKRVRGEEGAISHIAEHGAVKKAVKAFEKALLVSNLAFGEENSMDAANSNFSYDGSLQFLAKRRRKTDGLVPPVVLDVFAEAWDAWKVIADFGLRIVSSTLKATIEYDSVQGTLADETHFQNISIALRGVAVETNLETPRLFDVSRANRKSEIFHASTAGSEDPPMVEFPPTSVAETSVLTLPLRNPTAVPVKVRLGAAAPPRRSSTVTDNTESSEAEGKEKDLLRAKFGVEDMIREAYTKCWVPPFVQSAALNTTAQYYHAGIKAQQLWWDGAGGYFLADDYGDLIRSHHNGQIMAGAGAHVSLVNPSLHSIVAVVTGCGVRCGVRGDKQSPEHENSTDFTNLASPLGASAAAGVTLAGRTRSNMLPGGSRMKDEPRFAAAAATPGGIGGPSAFAIPRSALDEIVIPPYGEIEMGPILFRPPGRYSIHGCQVLHESGVRRVPESADKSHPCGSNIYESMIYIENSLTGLERIALQGKAIWEQIVFLDPPPVEPFSDDDFGDIELRNGHATLLFSGSRAMEGDKMIMSSHYPAQSMPGSVIKEILVHNSGDTVVDFARVSLSDTAGNKKKMSTVSERREAETLCSYKQFSIINCWDESRGNSSAGAQRQSMYHNVGKEFQLKPQENVSIFIEHLPDCSKPQDFVVLTAERRRLSPSSTTIRRSDLLSVRVGGGAVQKNAFRHRSLDLLVGYDMTYAELKSCKPLTGWTSRIRGYPNRMVCGSAKCKWNWGPGFVGRLVTLIRGVLSLGMAIIFIYVSCIAIYNVYMVREHSSGNFAKTISSRRKTGGDGISSEKTSHPTGHPTGGRGNWGAAFRCLARADPSSSDLQILGREQIRHVVLGRYKSMGILSPQCFNSNGMFVRERGGRATNASSPSQVASKEGSVSGSGNERIRTLSDAMYRTFSTHQDEHMQVALPCGLAWRVAASRGVAIPDIASRPPFALRTADLLLHGAASMAKEVKSAHLDLAHESTDDSDQEDSSSEEEQSSEGEMEDEEYDDDEEEDFSQQFSEDQVPGTSDDVSEDVQSELTTQTKEQIGDVGKPEIESHSEVKVASTFGGGSAPEVISSASTSSREETSLSGTNSQRTIEGGSNGLKPSFKTEKEGSDLSEKVGTLKPEKSEKAAATTNDERPILHDQDMKAETPNQRKSRGSAPSRTASSDSVDKQKSNRDKDKETKNDGVMTSSSRHAQDMASSGKGKPAEAKNHPRVERRTNRSASGEGKAITKGSGTGDDNGVKKRGKRSQRNKSDKSDNVSKGGKRQSKEGGGKRAGSEDKIRAMEKRGKKGRKGEGGKEDSAAQNSATKDKGTAASIGQTDGTSQAVLRPPPGLAPPPGFGGQSTSTAQSTLPKASFDVQLLPPSAFMSDASVLGSTSSAALGTPSRPTSAFTGLSPSILGMPGDSSGIISNNISTPLRDSLRGMTPPSNQQPPSSQALLESVARMPLNSAMNTMDASSQSNDSMAGFDVMDFLDSILNEGNTAQMPPSQPPSSSSLNAAASPVPPLSSNPWATEPRSRASAYGIEIDEAAGTGRNINMSGNGESGDVAAVSMPVLDIAAIMHNDRRSYGSNGGDDDDDEDDNGDSFYASLLGGHQHNNNHDEDDNYSGRS